MSISAEGSIYGSKCLSKIESLNSSSVLNEIKANKESRELGKSSTCIDIVDFLPVVDQVFQHSLS